jgi:hypothetical protein
MACCADLTVTDTGICHSQHTVVCCIVSFVSGIVVSLYALWVSGQCCLIDFARSLRLLYVYCCHVR